MNSTLDVTYAVSLPSTFSWDISAYPTNTIVPQLSNGIPVYTGYAPSVQINLSSQPFNYMLSSAFYIRAVDFGDYYNTRTNVLRISGLDPVTVNHTYIMPGLYSIIMTEAEYSVIDSITWNEVTTNPNSNLYWPAYTGISGIDSSGQTSIIPQTTAIVTQLSTVNVLLSVVELLPTAYLSSNIPTVSSDIVFPLTLTLTPRFIHAGSFPIEKIVWDLGDGSPLLTKRRWDITTNSPFVSTGALSGDLKDPRNFDIVHTYTKQDIAQYTFYPSITAYASSTGSSNACAITIGPIKSPEYSATNSISLLQAEINENGAVIVGQIGDDIGVWKTQ
jgi:hypothetical protein